MPATVVASEPALSHAGLSPYARKLKDLYAIWFPHEAGGAGKPDDREADEDAKHGAQHDGRTEQQALHHQTSTMGRERDAAGRKKQPLSAQASLARVEFRVHLRRL